MAVNIVPFHVGKLFLGGVEVADAVGVSVEESKTIKDVKGSGTRPIAQFVAEEKTTGKIDLVRYNGDLLAAVMNATVGTGSQAVETHTATAAATITPTNASGGKMVKDYGVKDSTGAAMTKVASAPAIGQYAVNVATGAYTFNASQTGKVSITYAYTLTTGNTATVANRTPGAPVSFELRLFNDTSSGGNIGFVLYNVVIPKLSLGFKAGEATDISLDFEAYPDPATSKVSDYFYV